MKCSACHRPIKDNSPSLAGAPFGPVCFLRALAAAGHAAQVRNARQQRASHTDVVRDTKTADLFDGAAA